MQAIIVEKQFYIDTKYLNSKNIDEVIRRNDYYCTYKLELQMLFRKSKEMKKKRLLH